jgi:hypothetical protein
MRVPLNHPFIDGCSIAMSDYQRVIILKTRCVDPNPGFADFH